MKQFLRDWWRIEAMLLIGVVVVLFAWLAPYSWIWLVVPMCILGGVALIVLGYSNLIHEGRELLRGDHPLRTWSAMIADLGSPEFTLRNPIIVTLEDYYGEKYIASWPEVEARGSGKTDTAALNALKDAIADLYTELQSIPSEELGQLPMRWKRALQAVITQQRA